MMGNYISVQDALRIIHQRDDDGNPVPFSLQYWKWDDSKNVGGDLKTFTHAVETGAKFSLKKTGKVAFKSINDDDRGSSYLWLLHKVNGKEVII